MDYVSFSLSELAARPQPQPAPATAAADADAAFDEPESDLLLDEEGSGDDVAAAEDVVTVGAVSGVVIESDVRIAAATLRRRCKAAAVRESVEALSGGRRCSHVRSLQQVPSHVQFGGVPLVAHVRPQARAP